VTAGTASSGNYRMQHNTTDETSNKKI